MPKYYVQSGMFHKFICESNTPLNAAVKAYNKWINDALDRGIASLKFYSAVNVSEVGFVDEVMSELYAKNPNQEILDEHTTGIHKDDRIFEHDLVAALIPALNPPPDSPENENTESES